MLFPNFQNRKDPLLSHPHNPNAEPSVWTAPYFGKCVSSSVHSEVFVFQKGLMLYMVTQSMGGLLNVHTCLTLVSLLASQHYSIWACDAGETTKIPIGRVAHLTTGQGRVPASHPPTQGETENHHLPLLGRATFIPINLQGNPYHSWAECELKMVFLLYSIAPTEDTKLENWEPGNKAPFTVVVWSCFTVDMPSQHVNLALFMLMIVSAYVFASNGWIL